MLMDILNDWRRALLLKRERVFLSDTSASFILGFNEPRYLYLMSHFLMRNPKKKGGEKE
jgi:hypothetical protein